MIDEKKVWLYCFVIFLLVWSLTPVYYLLNISLMFETETYAIPSHFVPENPTYINYARILGFSVWTPVTGWLRPSGHSGAVIRGIFNSIIVAIPTALITVAIASPAAYAFGRIRFRFKNSLLFMLIGSRALPPVSIVLPYYFLYQMTGLFGTIIGLVVIYLSITIPLTTWVLTGFFATLPVETERAARVDGCSRLMAFRRVILPMASSGIAATGILAFLMAWNEFIYAWILATGTPAQTLPPTLPMMFFMNVEHTLAASSTILSVIPPFIVAIFFQRYILQLKLVDPVTVIGQ